MKTYTRELILEGISQQELFDWHARPGAFERLGPPWQKMKIMRREGSITDGSVLEFRVYQGPFSLVWEAHHDAYDPPHQFRDTQRRGPFRTWQHTHHFSQQGPHHAKLLDAVVYSLPLHPLTTPLLADLLVQPMLERMFTFRHERTRHDIMRHDQFKDRPRKKIAITGASGTVGTALRHFFTTGGHEVYTITRSENAKDDHTIHWDIDKGTIDTARLEGIDVFIHLAGESISQRWTDEAKARIKQSRVKGTRLLSEAIASLDKKPEVLLSASAVGYYGAYLDDAIKTEDSSPGSDFLAEVCEAWEESAQAARDAGIRVVHTRLGVVLTPQGGALEQMLTPFKMGVGGRVGSGKQYMSWVALDDVLGAMNHAMFTPEVEGPVNVTSPNPVTNKEFTKTLGKVLNRPTILPVPNLALYTMLGKEAATKLLLEGQRVLPKRLLDQDFHFAYPELEAALSHMLGK